MFFVDVLQILSFILPQSQVLQGCKNAKNIDIIIAIVFTAAAQYIIISKNAERREIVLQTSIPDFLSSMLVRQYGEETAERIFKGYMQIRPVTLRVNTLKSSPQSIEKALSDAGILYHGVRWSPDAFILETVRESEIRKLPVYENGEIYLQSLSSMLPPLLLSPKEKECILDMAAAPGGKTTQLAALSGGLAQITAGEKNKIRAERLKYNLEKQGAARVSLMITDSAKLDPLFSFDKILLDAPCSGSGTLLFTDGGTGFQTDGGHFSKELIARSAKTQEILLKKALQLLKPGGEMIYSTCSILKEENENILKKVLPASRAEIVPIDHPMIQELPLLPAEIPGVCCVCPTDLYEGFFIAKIAKRK